ncbi:hypothetical protein [Streptomyces purpurascens]|uniref:Uncharacterized protein n=1 Tax=Streptomyces purpurascens TaxID=1924 RepID=A0ABZ1MP80_STREF|nr:hypothetical protein [Streptomyces purpurascens]GHA48812.1 hypothetical protein GCM10010303_70130 [Streptomyces purpurascens]
MIGKWENDFDTDKAREILRSGKETEPSAPSPDTEVDTNKVGAGT